LDEFTCVVSALCFEWFVYELSSSNPQLTMRGSPGPMGMSGRSGPVVSDPECTPARMHPLIHINTHANTCTHTHTHTHTYTQTHTHTHTHTLTHTHTHTHKHTDLLERMHTSTHGYTHNKMTT
jgi:hypothetical protein